MPEQPDWAALERARDRYFDALHDQEYEDREDFDGDRADEAHDEEGDR